MAGAERGQDPEQRSSRSMRIARAVVGVGRGMIRLVPARLRKRLDDRVFYSIFNLTRVTNDNYGWRPEEPTKEPGEGNEEEDDPALR